MTTTLVLPAQIAASLHGFVRLDVESGAVLLASPVRAPNGDLRLLATELLPVPDAAYATREADQLRITSDGYVPALGRAAASGAVPIWLHTHPGNGSSPRPSVRDLHVDEQLGELFRIRADSEFYGAIIVSHRNDELTFSGRLHAVGHTVEVDRLMLVGPRLALTWSDYAERPAPAALFDRNIRAFGGAVQQVLQDLRIAVVGCGGTGSSVAEQLVRLGARHLLLVDPDAIAQTNVTRVYGSFPTDVGQPKVDVLAAHLRRIAPDAQVDVITSTITRQVTARHLIGVDVIFGCTDDNAGRLVLSRLSTYMLIPLFDLGVLLTSDGDGHIDGIHGRITILYPGVGCLVCRGRIDLARAASETLTPAERARRVDEGYAPALPGVEPAVVAYTSLVAAYAVGELLERLIHYGPEPIPSEILVRIHDREVSTNSQAPRPRHYCDPAIGKIGMGLTEPLLEQTWSA